MRVKIYREISLSGKDHCLLLAYHLVAPEIEYYASTWPKRVKTHGEICDREENEIKALKENFRKSSKYPAPPEPLSFEIADAADVILDLADKFQDIPTKVEA